ncbi:hypothetical protein BH11MYX2_BH11MYX2_10570 [soil metagenome]
MFVTHWMLPGLGLLLAAGCRASEPPPITQAWYDGFERTDLADNWLASGDGYRIEAGQLSAHGAHNHPLWLRRKLPRNVRIEFDAWSTEQRGDLKVEVFGDGHSYDPDGNRYTATGYEVIFGGWYNSKSEIARMDEHGTQVAARSDIKVRPGVHYHWRIERQNAVVKWYVDEMTQPFLQYTDPKPLDGNGHEYFAFNNWETDTWFDNLVITPL